MQSTYLTSEITDSPEAILSASQPPGGSRSLLMTADTLAGLRQRSFTSSALPLAHLSLEMPGIEMRFLLYSEHVLCP